MESLEDKHKRNITVGILFGMILVVLIVIVSLYNSRDNVTKISDIDQLYTKCYLNCNEVSGIVYSHIEQTNNIMTATNQKIREEKIMYYKNERLVSAQNNKQKRIDARQIELANIRKENTRLAKIAKREKELKEIRRQNKLAIYERKDKTENGIKNKVASNDIAVSRGSGRSSSGNWQTFQASYYTSSCYLCSGIGASGVDLRQSIYYNGMRVIATDPRVIPLWSIVEIKTSYGSFKAISLDTGGRIKNKIVDVLVSSKSEAFNLGRHNIELKVIRRGK